MPRRPNGRDSPASGFRTTALGLKLSGGRRPLRFWRNKHPFNDYVEARLAEDKAYQYEDFAAAGLPVPDTLKLFNPLADARFDRYKTHAQ